MKFVHEGCEICGKRIKGDEPILKVDVGMAKKSSILRTIYGLFNPHKGRALAWIHLNCIDVDYNAEYPELTVLEVENKLEVDE